MKVLITGGMGVIGAETSRKFVKEGHRPVVFARHRDDSLIGDIADKLLGERAMIRDVRHSGENFKALVEEEAMVPTASG